MRTKLTRRELLIGTALMAGGTCLCRALGAAPVDSSDCCQTPQLPQESYIREAKLVRIDLSKAPCLARNGSAAFLVLEDNLQMIIVRESRKNFYVLSRLCTHARQIASYVPERKLLMCNSFNHSNFHLDGRVAKGPAEDRLQTFACTLKGGVLEITV